MDCILLGDVGAPLLGVATDGKYVGVETLLTTKTELLKSVPDIAFILVDGSIDLTVLDNDDLWAIPKIADIYKAYKTLYKNRELTSLIQRELDGKTASEFKKSVLGFVSGAFGRQTGITLEQLDRMFTDRLNFEISNVDNGFFAVRRNILTFENILKNTEPNVVQFIKKYLSDNEEVFENHRMLSDEQEVFFCCSEHSVMPTYEEVRDIVTDSIDEYKLKSLVPKFHNYLGPFVNYQKGALGSHGSYVDGEYIKRALVAEVMNDVNFKTTIAERRSELAAQVIGDKRMSITPTVITGDTEYDADPIQGNEKAYYDVLCKWEDMCIERDMLEAPVEEWVRLGLDINKYLPDLPITRRVKPFNGIDSTTYEMTSDESKTFTKEKLASCGLTLDVFKGLHSGSPTANKWFKYAINLALLSTRYYTGGVDLPIGYDSWDFNKDEITGVSFDEKYLLFINNKIKRGNAIVAAEDIGGGASEDSVTFDDYGDIYSDKGTEYWFGSGSSDEADDKSGNSARYSNLLEEVMLYCYNSGIEHAFPEALIKCLRFGRNKPRSLQLDSLTSRVDLTTGVQVSDVDYSKPVMYDGGKSSLISSFVVADGFDDGVKSLLKECTGFRAFNKTIIGVGIRTKYQQGDNSIVNVYEYYDMQTLVNDEILQDKIANLIDGKIVESNPITETVVDVIQKVSRNVTTMSIQMNDAVMMSMISGYQDKLPTDSPAYKIIANINRTGFNMFTFANSLVNLKELTKNIKFIRMGKVLDKLQVTRSMDEVVALLNAEMLVRYGNIISKGAQILTTGNSQFNDTYNLWKTESDYSLSLTKISSEVNSTDVVGEYRKRVTALLSKLASDKGLPADTKWGLIAVKMSAESTTPTFYAMQNKNITGKIVVMSSKKITRDSLIAYDQNPSKILSQPMSKLIAITKATRDKLGGSSVPIKDVVNRIFMFVDSEVEETFTTIIINNMKG